MTRKTTTVMLENAECAGGSAHTVEKALRDVPGVLRAYVNPATEAAYVEYDSDRCSEADLEGAVESIGIHPFHPAPARRAAATSFPIPSERLPMRETGTRSRTWWAFAGFIAIAGFFLFTEHRAHLFGILPFLFLLACPFLHMFGHRGHGGHGGHGDDAQQTDSRQPDQTGRIGKGQRAPDGHQHPSGATRDDWRS